MPLELPNLDDHTYADLVAEALSLIPGYAPEWTNYNPSDPGITLIELFAYLTELLLYRQNRVTDANLRAFLKLLNGPDWEPQQALQQEVQQAVLRVRDRYRAVTVQDFETLAIAAHPQVARACCLPRRNLKFGDIRQARQQDRPGRISVIIVPDDGSSAPYPSPELLQIVKDVLEPRRLLTTGVHIVGPQYVAVNVRITLVLQPDAKADLVRSQAIDALRTFLHPLTGGTEGKGWPFGRNLYLSDIYKLLDSLPGVDRITKIDNDQSELAVSDPARLLYNAAGEPMAVTLFPNELFDAQLDADAIAIHPSPS